MRYTLLSTLVQEYLSIAERAVHKAAATGTADLTKLHDKQQMLLAALQKHSGNAAQASAAAHAKAAERRAAEAFTLTWRATGAVEHITGWSAAAKRVGYKESTLRVQLSRGKGSYATTLLSKHGGEDAVLLERVNYAPGVGRPKRQVA